MTSNFDLNKLYDLEKNPISKCVLTFDRLLCDLESKLRGLGHELAYWLPSERLGQEFGCRGRVKGREHEED